MFMIYLPMFFVNRKIFSKNHNLPIDKFERFGIIILALSEIV